MKLLLLSNSTNPGEKCLEYAKKEIKEFLDKESKDVLFIPYAAIRFSYDEYENRIKEALSDTNCKIKSIHHFTNPGEAIERAGAIMTGGGNTWMLVNMLRKYRLMEPIRRRIRAGIPYLGWSAGSNIACPTMATTNDMPVVNPGSMESLNLVPFQINPHYRDEPLGRYGGETREDRIVEYIEVNRMVYVVGLRESTLLRVENGKISLKGSYGARIFKFGKEAEEVSASDDLSFLL